MAERLVGRAWELNALTDLLHAGRAGHGRGFVVLGDAGIGKTTLATAFAARAESDGFTVGWGRCPEGEAVPYWPWRQALRAIDAAMPLAEVAPAGRAAMFGDVADRLARATAANPAAVILEDVHIADGPSLALLQFLTGVLPELGCVLLLTSRDNSIDMLPAAGEVLRSLPASFGRLTLAGLDRAETAELVEQVIGAPAAQLAEAVFERAGGNPFFAQELARLHAARADGSGVGPPAGVGQVVGRRLARLPQRTHDCLAAAAVLGDDAPLSQLATVAQVSVGEVLELLEDAVDARLVVLDGGGTASRTLWFERSSTTHSVRPVARCCTPASARRSSAAVAAEACTCRTMGSRSRGVVRPRACRPMLPVSPTISGERPGNPVPTGRVSTR